MCAHKHSERVHRHNKHVRAYALTHTHARVLCKRGVQVRLEGPRFLGQVCRGLEAVQAKPAQGHRLQAKLAGGGHMLTHSHKHPHLQVHTSTPTCRCTQAPPPAAAHKHPHLQLHTSTPTCSCTQAPAWHHARGTGHRRRRARFCTQGAHAGSTGTGEECTHMWALTWHNGRRVGTSRHSLHHVL